jgi:hypothetical protein
MNRYGVEKPSNHSENMVGRVGIEHVGEPEGHSHLPENHRATPARANRELVSVNFASWNQLERWVRNIDGLRRTA